MIRIFLTDDHELVRQGIRVLIERERDISVVGEAGSGAETLSKLAAAKPELLLLDLMLPDMRGIEVLEKVKSALPGLRVIILSMYDNKVHLLEALQRGADGYVIKGSSGAELLQAIHTVLAGRRYVSPSLTEHLIEYMSSKRSSDSMECSPKLTLREEEVLQLTAEGFSSSDIAERLKISSRTVEAHRSNLMKKLDIHNKAELVRYSINHTTPNKQ
jgi:DNA-binding NarL/FixJ family response regulator